MSTDTTPDIDTDNPAEPSNTDGPIPVPGRYNSLLMMTVALGEASKAQAQANTADFIATLVTKFALAMRKHSDMGHKDAAAHRFYRDMTGVLGNAIGLYHAQVAAMHKHADFMQHTVRLFEATWETLDEGNDPDVVIWDALSGDPDDSESGDMTPDKMAEEIRANLANVFGDFADVKVIEIPRPARR